MSSSTADPIGNPNGNPAEVKTMSDRPLRPVERRVRRSVDQGVPDVEIARRFRRSPEWVRRVMTWSELGSSGAGDTAAVLRPFERRVLHWRSTGADHGEIGERFNRSAEFIERVEVLAHHKLDLG